MMLKHHSHLLATRAWRRSAGLVAIALAALAGACDTATDPDRSPLDGLQPLLLTADSAGNAPPAAPGEIAPGFLHGTVLGAAVPGSGNDSLETMPRIAGAVVTAYAYVAPRNGSDELGEPEASAVADANGKFTLPTMPGGAYIVTIEPPAGSAFAGVYIDAYVHAESGDFPWWVILPRQ